MLAHLKQKRLQLHQQLVASTQLLWQLEDALDRYYWQTHGRISARLHEHDNVYYSIKAEHWLSWLMEFEQEHQHKKRCFRSCKPFTNQPVTENTPVNESIELAKIPAVCQRHKRLVKRWRLVCVSIYKNHIHKE